LAIRFALAKVEMHRCMFPPDLLPEMEAISGVGTISWFLLPVSTCRKS
jgi:hypothetical protein